LIVDTIGRAMVISNPLYIQKTAQSILTTARPPTFSVLSWRLNTYSYTLCSWFSFGGIYNELSKT